MFLKSPDTLILASSSVYRRELLARLQIPFEWLAPAVDETPGRGETGWGLAARLARAKAHAVAQLRPHACVVGSDQVAVLAGEHGDILWGKPASAAGCVEQLLACSGRTLRFLTAVAVGRHGAGWSEFIDTTSVTFRDLRRDAVERYVEREAPLDCAGGFKCEGLGIALCAAIEGSDPTGLIGLPLIRLCEALRRAGFEIP